MGLRFVLLSAAPSREEGGKFPKGPPPLPPLYFPIFIAVRVSDSNGL